MAKLTVIEGPDVGTEHDLGSRAAPIAATVGRDPGVNAALQDTAVSRRHFRVEFEDGSWCVVDLGSRNQTFLNGRPVSRAELRDGDVLRAGDSELRFEDSGTPVESATVRSTILREVPAAVRERDDPKSSVVRRIEAIERVLEEGGAVAARDRARDRLEVYSDLGAARTPEAILAAVVDDVVSLVDADRGAILLEERGAWVAKVSRIASGKPGPLQASMSVIERVSSQATAVLCTDTAEDERFRGKESVVGGDIASVIAAPVRRDSETLAVLYVDRTSAKPPFDEADLHAVIDATSAVATWLDRARSDEELHRENRNLYRSLGQSKRIIGESREIVQVLDFIRRAAPAPMTVLIQGETGTGKELVASAIHYSSPRRGRPFVAINCAALPENLVESELFGHERGAFTGAVARRKGRFELAEGGTVFLDEVGELSLACQAKLLRLLEEKVFERVGGAETIRVDVRVVAASNKNLLDAVAERAFREDLYYRLNVLEVSIPPLRERSDDILTLAEYFVREGCGSPKRISDAARRTLLEYAWPGNVRQLRNVIESAVVLGKGDTIEPDDLVLPEPRGPKGAEAQAPEPWEPMSLSELEKMHIRRVLEHTGGNKKKAAEILGIERCTLYAKLKNYKL